MGKYRHIIALVCFFALVFILFGKTLGHRFNSDDYLVLYHATHHSSQSLVGGIGGFLAPTWGLYYRPVIKLFFDFLAGLFDLWPAGYHLVSLICYALLCFQVYWLGLLIDDRWFVALGAAVVFMVSSAHSEAIFWVSSLNGVVENLLVLLSLVCFIAWRQKSRRFLYSISLMFFGVALLTKESAIVLPMVLIFYDAFLGGDFRWPDAFKRTARSCWPFVLAGILFVMLRSTVMKQVNLPPPLTVFNVRTFIIGLWYSLIMTLSPIDWALALNWFDKLAISWAFYVVAAAALLLIAMIPLLLKRYRVTFLLWWILAGAVPVLVLGLVPSERHIVFGSVGAALLISFALFALADRMVKRDRIFSITLGCVLIAIYAVPGLYFLEQRQAIWKRASDLTADLIDQTISAYPTPEQETTFFFLNVPDTLDGALVFRFTNLAYALRLYYGDASIDALRIVTLEKVPSDALSSFQSAYFKIGAMGGHVYLSEKSLENGSLAARWHQLGMLGVLRKDGQYLNDWHQYSRSPFLIYTQGVLRPSSTDELKTVLGGLYSLG